MFFKHTHIHTYIYIYIYRVDLQNTVLFSKHARGYFSLVNVSPLGQYYNCVIYIAYMDETQNQQIMKTRR